MNMLPAERADKVGEAVEDESAWSMGGEARAEILALVPPGSLVLTSQEAETVRVIVKRHDNHLGMNVEPGHSSRVQVARALALLSPTSNVETSAE